MTRPPKHLSAFPITPCDPGGRVDAAALRRLLEPLVAARVDSIGLLGSTGTYPYLTRAERRRALEACMDVVDGAVPVLAGVGALRTDEAVALAQDAKAMGATAGLLAPMSYTPLRDDEVFVHFETVAVHGGLPLHVYDNPSTTHFSVSPSLLTRLAQVPGIVALKSPAPGSDAVADRLRTLRGCVPEHFAVGCSMDWHAAGALLAGADAWYSVAAGLFPKPCLALSQACGSDPHEAERLDRELAPLWALFQRFTSLRTVYAAADILGLCRAEPPKPILPLDGEARREIAATLRDIHLI